MDGIGVMTEAERDAFEERAAIVEFEAGWPRPIAEAEARRMIGALRWWACRRKQQSGERRGRQD